MSSGHVRDDFSGKHFLRRNDVANGMKYLLSDDDMAMVKINVASNGTVTISQVTMDTSNSKPSGTPQTILLSNCVAFAQRVHQWRYQQSQICERFRTPLVGTTS
jgi:hypothetical protein